MKSILSLIRVTTVCHAFCVAVLLAIFGVAEASAQISNANPRLLFTDLESGPNTGGKDNLGAFITLYGEGFGAQRGNSKVTIGGVEVAKYMSWGQDNAFARTLDMIVVQPGPNVQSGNIVVTVNGQSSNTLPFTVRSGNIYFVVQDASNASDSNPGTFDQPFKTLLRQSGQLAAGDIVYVKGGTFNTADTRYPGWDCVLCLFPENDVTGTALAPIAWAGYPGEPPILGAPLPMRRGLIIDETIDYYTIANMRFTAYGGMMELRGDGHRIVGNYLYDGIYSNSGAIGITGNSAHYKIYGNRLRNNGEQGNKMNGSGFYLQGFGTNEDIDFGWNHIEDQRGSRSIQVFGHVNGDRINNVRIHDNLLIGSELNNIVLGGSDGNNEILGTVYVYNNILVGSGTSGLRVNDPQGTVFIFNNVLYNNGSKGIYEDEHAQFQVQRAGTGLLTFRNNILYAESGETYYWLEPGLLPSVLNAGNNLWFNSGTAPAWDVYSVNADPLFVNVSTKDFHLKPGSPAIDAGTNTVFASDYEGVSRPQGRAFDIGAYEYLLSTYTLTVTTVNGIVVKNPDQASYNYGTTVTLTATPNQGYTFTGWTGDATSSTNPLTVTMNGNKNITANFAINRYAVALTANPTNGGTVSGSGTYDHGSSVTVIATAKNIAGSKFQFINWTENGSEVSKNSSYTFTIIANRNLVANFLDITSVKDEGGIPAKFILSQNYPNPFNPTTKIQFSIPKRIYVKLNIYNVLGQEIVMLVDNELSASTYSVDFDATELPNGIYFYKIQAGEFVQTKKMILTK
ncbi:MAG: T9SS type A sorting domain-containing protein [Ignavibacteriales bacterium]|nr:T9SS type A sorting domain-containing protein [Ignavibacteriales bacterium]